MAAQLLPARSARRAGCPGTPDSLHSLGRGHGILLVHMCAKAVVFVDFIGLTMLQSSERRSG